MRSMTMTAAIAVLLAVPLRAGVDSKSGADLSGRWTLTTSDDGPHGAMTMALALAQDGRKVTGSLATPHGEEIALRGEFDGTKLKLANGASDGFTLDATLKADGTLAGYLSSARGDLTWTGRRVKPQDKR